MLETVTQNLLNASISDVTHVKSDIGIQLGEKKLWFDSPWRLEAEGRIVMGNDNLVELSAHEDYKFDYDSAIVQIKSSLKSTSITICPNKGNCLLKS